MWLLPAPVALALVASLGYFISLRSRRHSRRQNLTGSSDLLCAEKVIRELEAIASDVRRNLANHHASILRFKDRIDRLAAAQDGDTWQALSREAECILEPTEHLSAQIAHAYDGIRQRANQLLSFNEGRTDPLTGLANRRAMEDALSRLFAQHSRHQTVFAVALIDLDHFRVIRDQRAGDEVLRQFADLLARTARNTDLAVRYSGEEFAVVLPQADGLGGCMFAERLRQCAERELPLTLSVGVAQVRDGDGPHSLLARADAALYSAKAAGRNCVCRHTGDAIERVPDPTVPANSHTHGANHAHFASVTTIPCA
jgi:diguanylate cyclase (GGDEF)-like protein